MRHSNTRIAVIALIVLCTVAIDVTWKHYLEHSARVTAKYSLNNIKSCVNDLLLMDEQGLYTKYGSHITNNEVEKALKTCARNSLVTPTGDVFAYDLKSLDFVFDPSLDCYVEGGKKMTLDSECTLHKDPTMCKWAMGFMNTGYDSDLHHKVWWQFDDAREYLEWVVLPDENRGFDGEVRSGNGHPHQVVVAQGVQEDELWARYSHFRITLYAIGFMSIIINLLLSVHENVQNMKQGRRNYDK